VIHRDVKPANIMLDAEGVPLLMDFGLARVVTTDDKLTHDGTTMGTPAYMSPEQAIGKLDEIGPATDQYSLGVILYELLAGKPPFEGSTAVVISRVLHQQPAAPTVINSAIPRALETICLKAMSKHAGERYASCQHLADELGRWLANEPIQGRELEIAPRFAHSQAYQTGRSGSQRSGDPLSTFQRIFSVGTVIVAIGVPALAAAIYWFGNDFKLNQQLVARSAAPDVSKSAKGVSKAPPVAPLESTPTVGSSKSKNDVADQVRRRWVHDNGEFRLLDSGQWQETSNGGGVWRYREESRNQDFIEIHALDGSLSVVYRLFDYKCDYGEKPDLNFSTRFAGRWMPDAFLKGKSMGNGGQSKLGGGGMF
jgi:serine/threonine protein kinase